MPAHSRRPVPGLSVTRLEDRTVPALFGVTWPDPQNLSVSFAKDGTDVGGVASTLQSFLGGVTTAETWQGEIRRAFQTWAAVTNIDVHVVGDSGAAFGGPGQLQANWGQGDIRIAARPLSTSQVAVANPPDLVSGWAGEIVLNSNYKFSVGGANGTYDLYSVMLHEIGHSLGLSSDHALAASAVMHEDYIGPRTSLAAADIAAIQKLYGVREKDTYDQAGSNGSTGSATAMNYLATFEQGSSNYVGGGKASTVVRADITKTTDKDVYKVSLPGDAKYPRLVVTTSSVSQLAAKVSVLDSAGKVLLTATASKPGADVSLDLKSLAVGKTYYVKVEAARGDVFGVGGYRLMVGEALPVAVSGFFTSVFSAGGETLETSNKIGGIIFDEVEDNGDARWDVVGKSQLDSATAAQTFQLTAEEDADALLVSVSTASAVSPNLRVTDSSGRAVAFEVLRADGYAMVIQLRDVEEDDRYTITLTSSNWQQPSWMGPVGYRFAADFRDTPITLTTFASGTLNASSPTASRKFTVTQSQLFRFELTASSLLAQPGATATLTVTDTTGKVVYALTTGAGQTVAGDVFLAPGSYTVKITASSSSGALLPLGVIGRITGLTDPIGPSLLDPTAPLETTPTTTAPTGGTTTTETARLAADTTTTATDTTTGFGYFWDAILVDPLKIWW